MSEPDETLTIAAAGDAMVTQRLTRLEDDGFRELQCVVADADASVVNLEGPLHNDESYPIPGPLTHFRSPPWAVDELVSTGFDLFAVANNHVGDYGRSGITATIDALERRALPHAGIGRNLAAARAPAYLETPAGRIALVAATTTYVPGTEAAAQRSDAPGRPGVAPLRLQPRYTVTDEHVAALEELREALGMDDSISDRGGYVGDPDNPDTVSFLNVDGGPAGEVLQFERGEENRIRYDPHPDDLTEIRGEIETANRNANAVIVSLHSHEAENGRYNHESVPPAVETIARGCIDAGADAFFCHGPHRVRGIELYDGAPIFYSLGNFALQYHTVPFFPAESYEALGLGPDSSPNDVQEALGSPVTDAVEKQGFVPVCTFERGTVREIRLYPIELGIDRNVSEHGIPSLATGQAANEIFHRLSTLSDSCRIDVRTREGIGIIEPE